MPCPSHIFLYRFCIWRAFKNKSDVCHVLCEELFMLEDTHNSRVDVEADVGVVSMVLMFFHFCCDKMTFSILQVFKDRERYLTTSVVYCTKGLPNTCHKNCNWLCCNIGSYIFRNRA